MLYNINKYIYIYIVVGGFKLSEKYENQLGMMTFTTEWENKIHVPNHQPDVYIYMFLYIYMGNLS